MDWLLFGFVGRTHRPSMEYLPVSVLASILASLASAFPALAITIGLACVLLGSTDGIVELVQGGWGFITVGLIVEFVLPISRRLR